MKKQFKEYLENGGIPTIKSKYTIYDYANAVEKVCVLESNDWEEFCENIIPIIGKYDRGGKESELGETGHRTWINALKSFQKFLKNTQK